MNIIIKIFYINLRLLNVTELSVGFISYILRINFYASKGSIVVHLRLNWRDIADRLQQALVAEPIGHLREVAGSAVF